MRVFPYFLPKHIKKVTFRCYEKIFLRKNDHGILTKSENCGIIIIESEKRSNIAQMVQ